MASIDSGVLVKSLLILFDEAYIGPPDYSSTWFTSNAPDSALLSSIGTLTAEQASAPQPGGTTIAAHTEHLRWALALASAYMRGEHPKADWEDSWKVLTVDADTWDTLRANLRREYEGLRGLIESEGEAALSGNPDYLTGTLSLIPHAAYHLGAILRMVAALPAG